MTDGPQTRLTGQFRREVFGATTAMVGVLAGCTGGGGSDDETNNEEKTPTATATQTAAPEETVDMTDNLKYDPASLTIPVGTTVVWENVGSVGHSVTAYEDNIPDGADYWSSGGFDTEAAAKEGYPSQGDVGEGDTYEHTFETAGTHAYYCIPHETAGMKGTIAVEAQEDGS